MQILNFFARLVKDPLRVPSGLWQFVREEFDLQNISYPRQLNREEFEHPSLP